MMDRETREIQMTQKPESRTCGCRLDFCCDLHRSEYNGLIAQIAALQSDHQLFYAATIAMEQELRQERDEAVKALKRIWMSVGTREHRMATTCKVCYQWSFMSEDIAHLESCVIGRLTAKGEGL